MRTNDGNTPVLKLILGIYTIVTNYINHKGKPNPNERVYNRCIKSLADIGYYYPNYSDEGKY